jgi:hypothetical protein
MRKAIFLMAGILCLSFSTAFSGLYTGTYRSVTTDSQTNQVYTGKVIIERCGRNYRLTWKEDNRTILTGIGVLNGSVLSVAFTDPAGTQRGVMSYRLGFWFDSELEGTWAYFDDRGTGTERLTYLNSYLD